MSRFPAPNSMPMTRPTTASSSNFEVIFNRALKDYQKKTKQNLTAHPLATQLQACDSPTAILTILQDQVDVFKRSRSGDERLHKWLNPTINVLYTFSATLSEGVGLIFSPAKVIFTGAAVLLLAAKNVEASEEVLIDVFERIENFFRRLEIYTDVPPTTAMTAMMVKIMVEVLDILGTVTKEMKQSRAKKFLKKVAGISKLEDGLKKLDIMTSEEARMASVEVLRLAHNIDKKVEKVDEKVRGIDENVNAVGEIVLLAIDDRKEESRETKLILRTTAHNVDDVKREQLLESLRKWQSPSDPSTNHVIASDLQHEGTAEWLCEGNIFGEWKATGSLLWIHGKPGSGKSVLCSAIINDIETLHKGGLASMAYFYFDFRDVDKRSRRDLLRSLLIQLSARSDTFCDILSRLYKEHDKGTRQPSDSALVDCLKEMLTIPDQAPVYLIMDALDECPNAPGVRSSREKVLELVKELVGLRLPSLHICVTSRPEADIGYALEGFAAYTVSLHNENGQKKDIEEYIKSVVHSPSDMITKGWREEVKDLVIQALSERADGMFRWVFCQLEMLRGCFPQNVPRVLTQLPATLDETYERVLKEIGKTKQSYAYRLLQCLVVAIRPLRVEELAEILALDFDGAGEAIPGLKKDWRWKDQQGVVLSTCSSLISVVHDGPHRVVQFSHYSVKEFLTSDRLATSSADISHFHILPGPAHTVIVKACLGILLQSENDEGDADAESSSPLAYYAAEHWVNHAKFEKVSTRVEDGMRRLFDLAEPYFEAWLTLSDIERSDIDQEWFNFTGYGWDGDRGSPLYYASLCGFRDLAAYLLAQNSHHVNSTVRSPLVAALYKRHFDIADLLYQHGAYTNTRRYKNRTLMHAASEGGFVNIVQWLLDHGVDANSQNYNHEAPLHSAETDRHLGRIINVDTEDDTPLHLASAGGHFEIVLRLLLHGADVAATGSLNRTPLHMASFWNPLGLNSEKSNAKAKVVQVLMKHGADVNARDGSHKTPLHLASNTGSAKTVRLLVEHGADVTAQDQDNNTPLHLASSLEWNPNIPESDVKAEIVQVLMKHGADTNTRDRRHKTPLHLASNTGSAKTVRLLIEHGADVTAQDQNSNTPLHLASSLEWSPNISESDVKAEIVQVLMKHGADVNGRDGSHKTPLHLASSSGDAEIVRLLIEHGADVTAQDQDNNTPLHLASSCEKWRPYISGPNRKAEILQVLMKHGADVNGRDGGHKTPLHLASSSGDAKNVWLLIEHGADVTAQDQDRNTPLHLASSFDEWRYYTSGPNIKAEIVQALMKHGADVNTRDGNNNTPLHLASTSGSAETVQLLVENGADVTAQDQDHNTPLHLASSLDERRSYKPRSNVKAEIVQVLMKHGADVNARDGGHKTPLHLASNTWSAKTVRLLVEHGADVTAQDQDHNTPLHLASSWDEWQSYIPESNVKAEIVQILMKHGADVNARCGYHKTPLHLASSSGSAEIVRLFIVHGADINARDGNHNTPLHLASTSGGAETMRLLIEHGADIDERDGSHNMPLHLASTSGSAEAVQLLIDHGADITAQDQDHNTPLHLASSRHEWQSYISGLNMKAEIVQALMKHGADVNGRDGNHNTPLHLASTSGSAETVRLLIEHGADVTSQDLGHNTPLHLASSWNVLELNNEESKVAAEIVRLFIVHGADVNAWDGCHETPLHLASSSGDAETVRLLIEHGADINALDGNHNMPLHLASSSGSAETVQLLVGHGADVTARDQDNNTPLHLASSRNAWELNNEESKVVAEIVQALVKHGADVNARGGCHETPLHLASSSGSAETVRLLTEHGADINARDGSHKTPLHLASSSGSVETVRLLVEHGADVTAQDQNYNTPLHLASFWSPWWLIVVKSTVKSEIVQVLMKHGADVNARDGCHKTPLHLALSSGSPETVRLLIEHGADINARDGSSLTPLHVASSNRIAESVHMLIEHGADVNAQDANHNTPLHLASSLGTAEIVRLLRKHGVRVCTQDGGSSGHLHQAPSSWDPEILSILVEHGADINARDGSHRTPLHLASFFGIAETVRLLIDHGADVHAQDGSHSTPLHLALSLWSPQNVWSLIKHNDNVNARDGRHKLSSLLELSQDENLLTRHPWEEPDEKAETVPGLTRHWAYAIAQDSTDWMPLPLKVPGLIQHWAYAIAQDSTDWMPLPLEPPKGSSEIGQHGPGVNIQNEIHLTPLLLVAISRLALEGSIVRLLLEHGADIDAKDDQCRTPLQVASSVGLSDIAQFLSDHHVRGE